MAETSDWSETLDLLTRTIGSILHQSYTEWNVYVIYTDEPSERQQDRRVVYAPFPYEFENWNQLKNKQHLIGLMKSEQKAVRRWDKARKICYGAKLAKEAGCDYIMAVDSDDLLSNQFLEKLVNSTTDTTCAGWYLNAGYLYKEGSSTLVRVPNNMYKLNGSTNILRSDLVPVPHFDSLNWEDYSLFVDHGWVRERIRQLYKAELNPLLQPMLVYVVHKSNMSGVKQKEFGFHWKAIVKRIIRTVFLTTALRREFNLGGQVG